MMRIPHVFAGWAALLNCRFQSSPALPAQLLPRSSLLSALLHIGHQPLKWLLAASCCCGLCRLFAVARLIASLLVSCAVFFCVICRLGKFFYFVSSPSDPLPADSLWCFLSPTMLFSLCSIPALCPGDVLHRRLACRWVSFPSCCSSSHSLPIW